MESQESCEDKEDDLDTVKTLTEDGEDEPSTWTPLQMSEILHVVMNFLDIDTLKTVRLVCKLWNVEAIQKLYLKYNFTVPSNFYSKPEEEQKASIAHMKQFLQDHDLFLPNIQVLSPRDIPTFISFGKSGQNRVLGPFVTKLAYGAHKSIKTLESLLKCMKNIRVIDTNPDTEENKDGYPKFCLELMKTCAKFSPRVITLTDFTVFCNFGEGSTCLDSIKDFSKIENIRVQVLLIGILPHSAVLRPCSLPDLEIETLLTQMSDNFSTILERNKNVMTSLWVSGGELYFKGTKVPKMPRMESFHMYAFPLCRFQGLQAHLHHAFPPGFQFATNFPNLNGLNISYERKLEKILPQEADKGFPEFWEPYFENQKPVLTVKDLVYYDSFCDLNPDPVLRCFPNLDQLQFKYPRDFSSVAKSIFTYEKNLKKFLLDVDMQVLISKISAFDAILTGFSQKTVDIIKNSPKDWEIKELLGEGMTLDDLRVQQSLFDLPHLELLDIRILGNVGKHLPRKIFTVAGKYAFGLLPKLKVVISVVEKEGYEKRVTDALKEVSELPNVTIT